MYVYRYRRYVATRVDDAADDRGGCRHGSVVRAPFGEYVGLGDGRLGIEVVEAGCVVGVGDAPGGFNFGGGGLGFGSVCGGGGRGDGGMGDGGWFKEGISGLEAFGEVLPPEFPKASTVGIEGDGAGND